MELVKELEKCIVFQKDPSDILYLIKMKDLESVFRTLGKVKMKKIFEMSRSANCNKPHLLESFYEVII